MKTVSEEFVRELIDFAPTEETKRMGFADAQLEGAVAGYNMLARNRIAYVADEVGMGKRESALRSLRPGATPRLTGIRPSNTMFFRNL